jgi:hypothetical protein
MALRICGEGVLMTVYVTGPRGRVHPVETIVTTSLGDAGIHMQTQFAGPLGGTWTTELDVSYQELVELLLHKLSSRPLVSDLTDFAKRLLAQSGNPQEEL